MTSLYKAYIDYAYLDNPDWFKEMSKNLYEIISLNWELQNSWAGWLWRRKEYKNTIKELRIKNRELLRIVYPLNDYPAKEYNFYFDIWYHNKKYLAMLHIFKVN